MTNSFRMICTVLFGGLLLSLLTSPTHAQPTHMAVASTSNLAKINAANITIGDGSAGSCTEGAIQSAIGSASDGDSLTFNCPANHVINVSTTIEINKDLTLDGGAVSGLALDGGNSVRVVFVANKVDFSGATVTLKNLIIQNGRATGQDEAGAGGGILTQSRTTLNLDGMQFRNNHAEGVGGGAFYGGWRSVNTISNSTFTENSTEGDDGTDRGSERGGGAIGVKSEAQTTITDTTFTRNSGTIGGAVNTLLGDLTVIDSTFVDNTSLQNSRQGYGGAIYTDGASATTDSSTQGSIIIRGSRFEGHTGRGQGGALFLFVYDGDSVTVEDSVIINSTLDRDSKNDSLGGGLRIGNGIVTIRNVLLANNRAYSQGGGLWLGGSQLTSTSIEAVSFIKNQAVDGTDGLAGAAALYGSAPITINQSTFTENYAGFQGGAFWGGGDNVTISNSIFDRNDSGNQWDVRDQSGVQMSDGGGNYQWPELTNLSDPQVFPVTTGNVYADPQMETWVDNGSKTPTHPQANNPVVRDGDSGAGATQSPTPTITPTSTTTVVPGVTIGDGSAGSCTETTLQNAIDSASDGDTLTFNCPANHVINVSTTISINRKDITLDGGAVSGLAFDGGNSVRVLFVEWSTVTLKNFIIKNGRATGQGEDGAGGGVRTEGLSTLNIDSMQFLNNHAEGEGGGAIYAGWRSNNTISNSTFTENSAEGNDGTDRGSERGGGAIGVKSESKTTIISSDFTRNSGTIGGAVNTVLGELTVIDSCFTENNSLQNNRQGVGGAIFTDGASATTDTNTQGSIIIRESRFDGNVGRGAGGAMYLFVYQGDNVTVEDSVIVNNTSQKYIGDSNTSLGGGLRVGNGIVRLSNLLLANNRAYGQGGGMWLGGSQTTSISIDKVSLLNNRAVRDDGTGGLGGGAAVHVTVPVTFNQTTFSGNYAGFKGGVFWGGGDNVTVSNSLFERNDSDNPWDVHVQTGEQMSDGGGNYEWPELTNVGNELVFPITAGNVFADPQLETWVDDGAKTPTHPKANNPVASDSGAGATQDPMPTAVPSATPTNTPMVAPSATPTNTPMVAPSATPTNTPMVVPSATPTNTPMVAPSATPTNTPPGILPTDTVRPTIMNVTYRQMPNDDGSLSTKVELKVEVAFTVGTVTTQIRLETLTGEMIAVISLPQSRQQTTNVLSVVYDIGKYGAVPVRVVALTTAGETEPSEPVTLNIARYKAYLPMVLK